MISTLAPYIEALSYNQSGAHGEVSAGAPVETFLTKDYAYSELV
jgi:hypothetical protein